MSSRRMPSKYRPLNYKRPVKSYDPHQLVEVLGLQDDPEYFESLKEWVLYAAHKFLNMERAIERQDKKAWSNFMCFVDDKFHFVSRYQEWWPIINLIEPHLCDALRTEYEEPMPGPPLQPSDPPLRDDKGKRFKPTQPRRGSTGRRAARSGQASGAIPPPRRQIVEVVIVRPRNTRPRATATPLLRPPDVWVEVPPRSF